MSNYSYEALVHELNEAFADQHMQPQIEETDYWEIDTDVGTEIVPADVVSIPAQVDFTVTGDDELEPFASYCEGEPDQATLRHGWLARLSAPGYMDCTEWSAFSSFEAAADYLLDTYGDQT
jgi:hypothetical protein